MGRYSGRKGFSLVEILVSAGLISVAVLASSTYFNNNATNSLFRKATNNKQAVADLIRKTIGNPAAIRKSMTDTGSPNNVALMQCLVMTGSNDCTNTPVGPATEFNLFDPVNNAQIAGTTANPICYDNRGTITSCALTANVVFNAITSYRVQCPPNPVTLVPQATCDVAETSAFGYSIQAFGAGGSGISSGVVSLPTLQITNQVDGGQPSDVGCVPISAPITGCSTSNHLKNCPFAFFVSATKSGGYCLDAYTGSSCAQRLVYRTISSITTTNPALITGVTWNTSNTPSGCSPTTGYSGVVFWQCCP